MKRTYLGEFEEVVLLTVAALADRAYGVSITHEISAQTDRSAALNQVHAALQRLEEKGMVSSRMGEPTPERGGRRKRLFTVTAYGYRALQEIREVRTRLWALVPGSPNLAGS